MLDQAYDAIYITHLHPDHFDRTFLSRYLRRHPGTPIVIAKFAHPWLKGAVARLAGGAHRVVELDSFENTQIGAISLRVVVADVCDPRVCGSSVPCTPQAWRRGIDSVGVFTAEGKSFCNANDALAVSFVPRLAKTIGQVDLLMGHYGGASPYPQCFPDVPDKRIAGRAVVDATCSMLADAANALGARYVMPFAGQYVLGGRLVALNGDRAAVSLDQAVEILREMTAATVFAVGPGGTIDLGQEEWSSDYVEPSDEVLSAYLDKISPAVFPYELVEIGDWESCEADLARASEAITRRIGSVSSRHDCSFVIGDGVRHITLNLHGDSSAARPGIDPTAANVTTIEMPDKLLWHLTRRKPGYRGFTAAHWNQADVGSHFTWTRTGEYDRDAHALLNFFGT
jgi:UDP-MurNAc hydroxylase